MMEHVHQHEDDKVHRRIVVIVKQHLVERGLLELPLGLGFHRLIALWSVYRHNTSAILSYGERRRGDKEKGGQGDKEKEISHPIVPRPLFSPSPCPPFPTPAGRSNWQGSRLSVSITAFDTVELFE